MSSPELNRTSTLPTTHQQAVWTPRGGGGGGAVLGGGGGPTCKGQTTASLQNKDKHCKTPASKEQHPMIYKVPSAYSLYRRAWTRGMYFIYTSKGREAVLQTACSSAVTLVMVKTARQRLQLGINKENRLMYSSSGFKSTANVKKTRPLLIIHSPSHDFK